MMSSEEYLLRLYRSDELVSHSCSSREEVPEEAGVVRVKKSRKSESRAICIRTS